MTDDGKELKPKSVEYFRDNQKYDNYFKINGRYKHGCMRSFNSPNQTKDDDSDQAEANRFEEWFKLEGHEEFYEDDFYEDEDEDEMTVNCEDDSKSLTVHKKHRAVSWKLICD